MTVACIPTIPGREKCLAGTLASIRGQFDLVCVAYLSEGMIGLPETEKLRNLQDRAGYLFALDDDCWYPPDFMEKTVAHIERHERRAVICYGGRRFDSLPVDSYYRGASERRSVFTECTEDWPCHVPIAAALAWHSDTIRFIVDGWPCPNMDVLTGVQCHDAGVPVICAPHPEGWFKDLMPFADTDKTSVYERNRANDACQTRLINARKWG